jgi:DNA-binding CsgD family transcriptional regulator
MSLRANTEARQVLARLSSKEREVLDRVLQHKPTKEIARELAIAPNTVDMRLRSARTKLLTRDRNETARAYQHLLGTCGKTTCGSPVMAAMQPWPLSPQPEPDPGATFVLEDSAGFALPAPWVEVSHGERFPEVLDRRFGRAWRIAAIPVVALVIALLALALLAIAETMAAIV